MGRTLCGLSSCMWQTRNEKCSIWVNQEGSCLSRGLWQSGQSHPNKNLEEENSGREQHQKGSEMQLLQASWRHREEPITFATR